MQRDDLANKDSLGYLVNRAMRALANRLTHNFGDAGHDVTAEQWQILVHLWHSDGLCQQRLSEMTGKDKTSITRLIDGLEKRSLVERTLCQNDRRRKLIYLTPKGKEPQKDLRALARKTQREAQRDIDQAQLDVCKDVLRRIHDNLSDG